MVSCKHLIRAVYFALVTVSLLSSPKVLADISLPADVGQGIFSSCTFNENNDEVICSSITNFNQQNFTINITQRLRLTVRSSLTLPGNLTINPQQQPFTLNVEGTLQNNGTLNLFGNIEASTLTLSGSQTVVEGSIQASSFTLNNGTVNGDADAGSVNLGNGNVSGNVTAGSLTNSATINGNVNSGSLMNNGTITGNARVMNPTSVSTELVTNNGSGFIGSVNSNAGVRNDGTIGTYINTPFFLGNAQPPRLCNTNPEDGNTTPCANGDSVQGFCEGITTGLDYAIIGTSGFNYSGNNTINGQPIRDPEGGVSGTPTTPTPSGEVDSVAPGFAPLEVQFPFDRLGTNTVTEERNIAPGSYGTVRTVQGGGSPEGNVVSFAGGGSYDYTDTDNIHYIRRLELRGNRSRAIFGPGIYFIDEVVATSQTYIEVAPAGRVIIHIGSRFRSDNETYINSEPGANPGNLVINMHSGSTFSVGNGNQGTDLFNFNGLIYSPYENTSITLANNNAVRGSILSSGTVSVGTNTTFDFSDEVRQQITSSVGCDEPTGPVIERFRIDQPQRLISCRAAPVRVRACANTDCSEAFSGPVSVQLQASSSVNWQGGDLTSQSGNTAQLNFTNGEAIVGMRKVEGGDVTLSIANSDPLAASTPLCMASNCLTRFVTSGIEVSTQDISKAGEFVESSIAAIETAEDGSCQARLANETHPTQLSLNCEDPAQCAAGQSLSLYSAAQEGALLGSAGSAYPLTFDEDGTASIHHRYTDVGAFTFNASVFVSESTAPDTPELDDPAITLEGGSTSRFYSLPYQLTLYPRKDDARFTDLTEAFAVAGEPFAAEVEARNAFGNITPSFGNESSLPGLAVSFVRATQPNTSTVSSNGPIDVDQLELNDISFSISNGLALLNNIIWDEVGDLYLQPRLTSYLGLSTNAIEQAQINKPEARFSRFYPAFFELGLSSVLNAKYFDDDNTCMATSEFDYTYLGQPVSDVRYEVRALNARGAVTRNYGANYYDDNDLTLATFRLLSETHGEARIEYTPTSSSWDTGRKYVAINDFVYQRRDDLQPDGPFRDERLGIEVDQSDEDGTNFQTSEFITSSAEPMIPLEGSLNLFFARLTLADVSGSELEPLPIVGAVEAYSFASNPLQGSHEKAPRFRPALFDQCTEVLSNQFQRANGPNVQLLGSDLPVLNGAIVDNGFSWQLTDAFDPDNAELRFIYAIDQQPWLGFPWRDEAQNQAPEAIAIFGQFRGNDRVIYWLERGF